MKLRKWAMAVLAAGAMESAQAQPANDLPPGWPRPGATLLVENDRGAAYNVVYPKDQPTPFHRHRYFFAGLDLNTATIKVTQLDGKADLHPVVENHMWYLPKDLTHQEMSTTDPGRHTVVIDIKDKHVPEAANTTGLPANRYATYQNKVVDNDRVTIWDCAWSPGREGVSSFDGRDMFLAFASGGELSMPCRASRPGSSITMPARRSFCPADRPAQSDRPAAPSM
jgi:hypothetical protein